MENKVGSGESGRRRFIRRLTTLGAAGGIATLLYGRVTEKPLIQLAQAASGGNLIINAVNDGEAGTTELDSTGLVGTFVARNTATGPNFGEGLVGITENLALPGANKIGVYGLADAGLGVRGDSATGFGVEGFASADTGTTVGVYGVVNSKDGYAVKGYATSQSGGTGVYGEADGWNGFGVMGWAVSGSGPTYGVWGQSDSQDGIGIFGLAGNAGTIPMVAEGTSGQTSSLQEWREWRNDSETTLAVVDKDGQLGIGTSAPVAPLHLYYNTPTMLKAEADGSTPCILSLDTYAAGSTTSGAGFVGRHSRGSKAAPTDVVVGDRLGFNIFGGYAGGAFRHVAGIEGVVDTGTVSTTSLPSAIRFLTTPDGSMSRQERMRIDANGNMIPPTDNSGSIGTASKRWSNLYVVTLHQGDIQFENNFTVTEDEKTGLAFKNDAGEKIAVLDRQGNLRIKGDFIKGL